MAGPLTSIALTNLQNVAQQPVRPQIEKLEPSKFDNILNKKNEEIKPSIQVQNVSKTTNVVTNILSSLEQGNIKIDNIIKTSLSSKNMSNQELLAMQAGMYKYTQELDLCSKVVDKAINGLKDVLKTQV